MKTPEQIKEEFLGLRETYYTLIGGLYPSMVYNELMKLRKEFFDSGGIDDGKTWYVRPPDKWGHV